MSLEDPSPDCPFTNRTKENEEKKNVMTALVDYHWTIDEIMKWSLCQHDFMRTRGKKNVQKCGIVILVPLIVSQTTQS